jgi:choline dehydrogenase-like flavoprotein
LPLDASQVETTVFHFGRRNVFYEDYKDEIDRSDNIDVYLHANVMEIETDDIAGTASAIRIKTLAGNQCRLRAKVFVLAQGGVETPRLLLLSRSVQKDGLGNQNDLVGRYFMEHPHLWSGLFIPKDPEILSKWGLYLSRSIDGFAVMGKLTVSDEVLRRERILNHCVSLHPSLVSSIDDIESPEGVKAASLVLSSLRRGKIPPDLGKNLQSMTKDPSSVVNVLKRRIKKSVGNPDLMLVFRLNHMSEQTPNPESRISLSNKLDSFGQNRVRLNWRLNELDIRTIVKAQQVMDSEMRRAGLGYLKIELKEGKAPPDIHGGWHHMGTTRMHESPREGVVNPDCRVHGVSNLFIAGASVFPTVGYANPVLTTVAMVLRLADHLKDELGN